MSTDPGTAQHKKKDRYRTTEHARDSPASPLSKDVFSNDSSITFENLFLKPHVLLMGFFLVAVEKREFKVLELEVK